jgi:peptidyl-prolyl cis-trans isomerase D
MMTQMRENMPLIMWILVGAFLATIVFSWGMGGFKSKNSLDGVVGKVGGREILYDQYNRLVQDRVAQQRSEAKNAPITDAQVEKARKDVWDDLVRNRLMSAYQERWGIVTSDDEVGFAVRSSPPQWIQKNENFLKDGQFDRAKYEEFLRDPRSKEILVSIEDDYRNMLGNQKVIDKVIAPVFVSAKELWDEYVSTSRKYSASVVTFSTANYAADSNSIAAGQIKSYYEKHHAFFEKPEQRKLAFVSFPIAMTHDDSSRVVDLAMEVVKRAEAGEDFGMLAEEYSEDEGSAKNGGDVGYFARGQMVAEFETAAFNNPVGKIVGPVSTQFGLHIIKVADHVAHAESDSVRASHILLKWKVSSDTEERLSQKAKDFADAAKTDVLAKVASRFGVTVQETDWFAKSSNSTIPGFGTLQSAADFAFSSKRGALSHVFKTRGKIGGDAYTIFQLTDMSPAGVAPLSSVEGDIRRILIGKKQEELALEAAKRFRGKVTDEASFIAEAARENLTVDTTGLKVQQEYVRAFNYDNDLPKVICELNPGQISEPLSNDRAAYVVLLTSKIDADPAGFAAQKSSLLERLRTSKQNAVYSDWLASAQKKIGVEDNRYLYYTDY